jgi:hypothetical protein
VQFCAGRVGCVSFKFLDVEDHSMLESFNKRYAQ